MCNIYKFCFKLQVNIVISLVTDKRNCHPRFYTDMKRTLLVQNVYALDSIQGTLELGQDRAQHISTSLVQKARQQNIQPISQIPRMDHSQVHKSVQKYAKHLQAFIKLQ